MRNCLLLAKILLKSGGGALCGGGKSKKYGGKSQIVIGVLLALCMIPLMALFFQISSALYRGLAPVHMEALAFELICVMISFMMLVFSLPFVLSVMFFSRDLEYLLPMPFYSWQIVGAKFITIMIYEYLSAIVVGLPLMAGIAAEAQAGVSFWLIAIPVLLAIPVIPVIYASFLGTLALYLTRNWKHKEALMTFFSLILIFFASGIGMLTSRLDESLDTAAFAEIMMGSRQIVTGMSWVFPNLLLAKNALLNTNFLMLLWYLLSAAALVGAFLLFGNRVYLKAVSGMTETSSKKERLSEEETGKALRASGAVKAFASREWKLLVRTPVYFLNCVITAFIVPVILFMMLFFGAAQMQEILSGLEMLLPLIRQSDVTFLSGLLLLVVFAVSGIMCSMNLSPATCISREGQNFGDLKCIPVSVRDILKGKMICSLSISAAAVYPYAVALPLAGTRLFQTPLWLLVPSLFIATFTIMAIGYLMLFGDLIRPKLNWASEQAAVKQNLTATITDFICMAVCLVLGFGFVMLYRLHVPIPAIILTALLVTALLAFVLRHMAYRYGEKAFARLEL